MVSWQEAVAPFAHNLEQVYDGLRNRLNERLGGSGPLKILSYRGFGTRERLSILGRVIEDPGEILSQPDDSLWQNLLHTYRRLATHEVPYARVRARCLDQEQDVAADEEGFFKVEIHSTAPNGEKGLWQTIDFELLAPRRSNQPGPVQASGQVLVPPPSARYGVISDIDDTVVQTDAAHWLSMARTVFLGNARTRLPFPGVAAFLRALFAGPQGSNQNPLFYVSSSPWNLYDLLSDFFSLNDIPIGPVLFLRDWGLTKHELFPLDNRAYKLQTIRLILDVYPHLPFILIGDSGQQDPEIYTQVTRENPERILAVYIRNISRGLARPQAIHNLAKQVLVAGSTLILADDTLALAQHAAAQGWIRPEALPDIHVEKKADEGPATPLEALLAKDNRQEGQTQVIQGKSAPGAGQPEGEEINPGAIQDALQSGDPQKEKTPTVVIQPKKSHVKGKKHRKGTSDEDQAQNRGKQ